MVEKYRKHFIRIAMAALSLAMILVVLAINVVNYVSVRSEMVDTMKYLAQSGHMRGDGQKSRHRRNLASEARFFVVKIQEDGSWTILEKREDQELEEADLPTVIEKILEGGREEGIYGSYAYTTVSGENPTRLMILLNWETRFASIRSLAIFSAAACLGGILLAFIAVSRYSRRAARPFLVNEEQQKRFITDASHELKTPLTVIGANMDVLNLEIPDNTWVHSTQKQVSVMRRLVDELVYLFRMEESGTALEKRSVCLTDMAREMAEPMAAMAEFHGKELKTEMDENIHVQADPQAMERMLSILLDNAVKYTPEDGKILFCLEEKNGSVTVRTVNDISGDMTQEACSHLFDRFYRSDASRSRDKGGYGIGLSIVKAVAERHGGKVSAEINAEGRLEIRCQVPAE